MRFALALSLIGILLLAACGGGSATPTPEPPPEPTPLPIDPLPEPRLMAWIRTGSTAGEIVLLGDDGAKHTLITPPDGTSRVQACGESSTSLDGTKFSFFVGNGDRGVLHQITGTDVIQPIAEVGLLACTGMGTFIYGEDRSGFIDFLSGVSGIDFPTGDFILVDLLGGFIARHENVGAFDFRGQASAFISGFRNADDVVTEVAVYRLDEPDGTPIEVSTLFSNDDCRFVDGSITIINPTKYIVVMGQSCTGGSEWSVYQIDAETNRATLDLSGGTGGGYFADVRTGSVFAAPSGLAFYFSYPNGFRKDRADWKTLLLADMQEHDPIVRFGVMPSFSAIAYDPTANAVPVVSRDGRWFATVSQDADDNTSLHIIDLNVPDLPPITIPTPDAGDLITSLAFTPDGQRLVFVSGGADGENNSLFAVDLNTAADSRILRGRFAPGMVTATDIPFSALVQWSIEGESRKLEVVTVNLDTAQSDVIFTGSSEEFVHLLSWR